MRKIYAARHVPRERDNEVIGWIQAKCAGSSWSEIASGAGKKVGTVEQACRLVLKADVAESGEDFGGAYWGDAS